MNMDREDTLEATADEFMNTRMEIHFDRFAYSPEEVLLKTKIGQAEEKLKAALPRDANSLLVEYSDLEVSLLAITAGMAYRRGFFEAIQFLMAGMAQK